MDESKQTAIKRIKLLITIVDRGKGNGVVEILRDSGTTFNLIAPGYGAAGSQIMDYLGLTSAERDLVLSVVTEDKASSVLNKILYKFDLDLPGNGLAFTIPISGVSGPLALRFISGIQD